MNTSVYAFLGVIALVVIGCALMLRRDLLRLDMKTKHDNDAFESYKLRVKDSANGKYVDQYDYETRTFVAALRAMSQDSPIVYDPNHLFLFREIMLMRSRIDTLERVK